MADSSNNQSVRFGVFQLDLRAGELRKNGSKVKLQEQPFQVLAALVEKPGEVVLREELRERLWPDDAFGDFDHSLSTAINKIRQVLGDSASHPRFIETIPRRGYRFLAEVSPRARQKEVKRPSGATQLALFGGLGLLSAVAVVAFLVGRVGTERGLPPAVFTPVPVTSFRPGIEYHAAVSPDGGRVAFARFSGEGSDLYAQTIGSDDEPIRLTEDPNRDFSPTWSPDGNYLAFVRFSADRSEIFRIPSIGGPERKLGELVIPNNVLQVRVMLRYLDWSPDGRFLAVTQYRKQDSPLLYQLEIETGEQTPLPYPELRFMNDPAYAPDGRSLAYAGFERINAADVWLQDLAESGEPVGVPRRLTRHESYIDGLDWTADGREIVFSSGFEHVPRLWRVAIEGDQPPLVQNGGELGRSPSIAVHLNRLVYGRREYDSNILSVPGPLAQPAGQSVPGRLIASTRADDSVDFSPDGKRIVFVSGRTGNKELWTSAADGSDAKRITSWNGRGTPGSPRWSRDGQFIAFDGVQAGLMWGIYVVRADGGEVQRVTDSDSMHNRPAWSRDGTWIYSVANREGKAAIWKTPPGGGEPIQVADYGGFVFYESDEGSLYFHDRFTGNGDVWRIPAGGGDRERVIADVGYTSWAGFDGGICFVKEADNGPTGLWFYDFSTRKSERFGELPEGTLITGSPGLAVSPDGKQLVFGASGDLTGHIIMLDGFR